MFGKKDSRNLTEKNNDSLVIWQYLGGPVILGIAVILLFAAIFGYFSFTEKRELAKANKIYETRNEVLVKYMEKNPQTLYEE